MEKHHGQLVERVVRRSGMSLSELARKTKVNRRSLYNWFQQPRLNADVILKIGSALNYDFSSDFPDYSLINRSESYLQSSEEGENFWMNKYIDLAEKYNALLSSPTFAKRQVGAA